jgi:hypothetical protein
VQGVNACFGLDMQFARKWPKSGGQERYILSIQTTFYITQCTHGLGGMLTTGYRTLGVQGVNACFGRDMQFAQKRPKSGGREWNTTFLAFRLLFRSRNVHIQV